MVGFEECYSIYGSNQMFLIGFMYGIFIPTVSHKNQPIHVGKYTIYMDPIWVLMHLLLYSWHVGLVLQPSGGVFSQGSRTSEGERSSSRRGPIDYHSFLTLGKYISGVILVPGATFYPEKM